MAAVSAAAAAFGGAAPPPEALAALASGMPSPTGGAGAVALAFAATAAPPEPLLAHAPLGAAAEGAAVAPTQRTIDYSKLTALFTLAGER